MRKTRRYSKKALYENIMYRIQKELKRPLNEDENENEKIKAPAGSTAYSVAYVDYSIDGYSLYTSFYIFSSYEKAFDYVTEQQQDSHMYTYIIDYVTDTYWEWDDATDEYIDSGDDNPDTSNDGYECRGSWVIQEETIE